MGKQKTKKRQNNRDVLDEAGLSPDEERACEAIARIIAKMQARVRAEAAAMKQRRRHGVVDV